MENTNTKHIASFQPYGNRKLLDYVDSETGKTYKYAQFNTRAKLDCPFMSKGCAAVCYAATGLHNMPSCKESRERAYRDSTTIDFSSRMIDTIESNLSSKRYKGSTMVLRLHESGDFYNIDYLRKWVNVFSHFADNDNIVFCFYTKSFQFFLDLAQGEKDTINRCLNNGVVSINLSIDDTTTAEQLERVKIFRSHYPLSNVYHCTTNIESVEYDDVCKCENCAKCGLCLHPRGKTTVVKIHSASKKQLARYESEKRV